jgi:alkylation response protein AidB-like acyl-CoA dehydrogenase
MIDLLPSAEQQQIVDSVASILAARLPYERFRPVPSPVLNTDQTSWPALGELGVFGLGLPESLGGIGFNLSEEVLVARELGRFLVSPSVLATMVAAHLAAHAGQPDLAQAIGRGDVPVAAALPVSPASGKLAGAYHLVDAHEGLPCLVWTPDGAGLVASEAWRDRREVPSIDTTLRLERAHLETGSVHSWVAAPALARHAGLLVSAYLVGIAEAALADSLDYAKIREQFGQPIGAFQAVKHRCADMMASASAAWNLTIFATLVEIDGTPDAAFQGIAAKLMSAQAAFRNAAVNIQNHGGFGFTGEHFAHLFVKRAHVLDRMGGDTAVQRKRMLQAAAPAFGRREQEEVLF